MFNKRVLKKAVDDLDKVKKPTKSKDIIYDPAGQWKFPGQPTRIPSNTITMEGVDYPLLAVPNYGEPKIMMPGQYYEFPEADYVDEYPEFRKGGIIPKYLKMPKNYGRSKYSSNISATNKVFARNILFRNERHKIYDPKAKYQDGGEPEDYSQFQSFAETLPSNLQDPNFEYGNPDQYNLYGMWETVGKPQSFQDVQDSDYFPLQEDNTYHGFTVGSDGEFLKPMSHGTTWKEVMNAHLNTDPFFEQNRIIKNEKGRLQYVPDEEDEYIEAELTPEEIQEYAKGGYVIEDISVPSLTKAQRGLFKKKDKQDPNKLEYREPVKVQDELVESVTPFPEAPEDFKKGVANLKEVEAGPYWLGISREYSDKHNKQAFIDKKKRQYLNRGLAKAAGLNMENFPKNVEKNFINEYNYKRNNYVVKKLFKNAGISPNKREEWIDTINSDDNADVRALIKNSKYGNKLKPSIWARTLAGLGTMASKFSPEIADAMERGDLPGLSREEQRAIKNANIKGIPVGGVEALAGADAVGVALANALEASGNESYGGGYKKAPGLLSGDVMPKITDDQIAVLNPSTYTVGYDFAPVGKGLLKGASKIGKAGVKTAVKSGKTAKSVLDYGKDVVETSKKAKKFSLPTYSDVYRAEHGAFDTPAINTSLTGRWFADNPMEAKFYATNLKDPVTGEVIKNTQAPVRIMKKRMPEYKIKENFGASMPEEARIMSMGKGDLTDTQLNEVLGPGADRRFRKGVFTQGDLNALSTAPFLFNKAEGILDPKLVNKLRNDSNIFKNQEDAVRYLFNEAEQKHNAGKLKKYLPFKQGGIVSDLSKKEIDKLVAQGYIVETID